jgi:hypothetical protein
VYFLATAAAMMGDNIEHVISYWVFEVFTRPSGWVRGAVALATVPVVLSPWCSRRPRSRRMSDSMLLFMGFARLGLLF